jgi:beta-barrel assembly-enhancing protease
MSDGVYYDGKSAKRHPVRVSIVGTDLEIRDEENNVLARWPFADLQATVEDTKTGALRIVHTASEDAVLIATNAELVGRIRAFLPAKPRKQYTHGFSARHVAAVFAVTVLVGALIYFTLPKLAQPIAALVPLKWEQSLGERVLTSIPGARNTCHDPAGTLALANLTARLGAVMELPYPVKVSVAELEFENAFATPGGFIVIGNSLLVEMESPNELAGVLAHEMAHIAERHPMSRAVRIMGLSLIFEMLIGGDSGLTDTLAQGAGILLMFAHSRDDERMADQISLDALKQAGIQTDGLAAFFTRLEKKYAHLENRSLGAVTAWLRTHPSFAERKQTAAIKPSAAKSRTAMSTREWTALKSICNP